MSGADRILRWSPMQVVAGSINRARVAVLAYHGVDDPEIFRTQMDRLVRHYRPVEIEELDRCLRNGETPPDRSVVVTFDDGYRSVLDHALPILSERSIPAVAFVIAGLIDTNEDFWWSRVMDLVSAGGVLEGHAGASGEQLVRHLKTVGNDTRLEAIAALEESAGRPAAPRPQLEEKDLLTLEAGGIAVGNHTWSHPCLNRCDLATTRLEIQKSHQRLQGVLGTPPRWFAYPNGDWDQVAEDVITELDYRIAFLFDHRHAQRATNPLRVSRLRVNSDTGIDRFALILSGLHPGLHHIRGRG